jgi:hypothetical protein
MKGENATARHRDDISLKWLIWELIAERCHLTFPVRDSLVAFVSQKAIGRKRMLLQIPCLTIGAEDAHRTLEFSL